MRTMTIHWNVQGTVVQRLPLQLIGELCSWSLNYLVQADAFPKSHIRTFEHANHDIPILLLSLMCPFSLAHPLEKIVALRLSSPPVFLSLINTSCKGPWKVILRHLGDWYIIILSIWPAGPHKWGHIFYPMPMVSEIVWKELVHHPHHE